ncbi:reverse transcriptase [Corchorus capsularis]|uniref:Reverse transcriptase n=1 Tax=Corchorus capsularis TaxID=210143 RepID=A0A1R3J1E8_COCAP|nr:reverse transcriptase [Corchorus capsularis]
MIQDWKPESGLTVKKLGERLFLFQFKDGVEKDRVLDSQPWSFQQPFLLLRNYDGFKQPESIELDTYPFWICVFGLPPAMMNDMISFAIGSSMVLVQDVDDSDSRFLRIRVGSESVMQGLGSRFRNHVNSLALRGRWVAHGIAEDDVSCEIVSDFHGVSTQSYLSLCGKAAMVLPDNSDRKRCDDEEEACSNNLGGPIASKDGGLWRSQPNYSWDWVDYWGPSFGSGDISKPKKTKKWKKIAKTTEKYSFENVCQNQEILLGQKKERSSLPWCYIVDFNEIHLASEKEGVLCDPLLKWILSIVQWSIVVFKNCLLQVFGNVKFKIAAKCKAFEREFLKGALGDMEVFEACKDELEALCKYEETMWRQRSKELWLKEGDKNIRYIHALASVRKHRKTIAGIRNSEGVWLTNPAANEGVNSAYYKDIFFSTKPSDESIGKVLEAMDNHLDDGLPLPKINHTNVVLIAKVSSPETVKDFRPIGLCNVVFKIVSEALANRLKLILPQVIGENQSAFVPECMIFYNAMIAFETIHFLRNKIAGRKTHMALKLDLSKAYDRVEWDFLESYEANSRLWKLVWSSGVMPKMKYFFWRVFWNILPIKSVLRRRGLEIDDTCDVCGGHEDSMFHALFECPFSMRVWDLVCPWVASCLEDWSDEIDLWDFFLAKASRPVGQLDKFLCTLWLLWKNQNNSLHNSMCSLSAALASVASNVVQQLCKQDSVPFTGTLSSPTLGWVPPSLGLMKINVDTSFCVDRKEVGLGVVVRDNSGSIVDSASRMLSFVSGPLYAEVHALLFGFEIALELGVLRCIVESDCRVAIDHIDNFGPCWWEGGNLIYEIWELALLFDECSFSHVHREVNALTHNLASLRLDNVRCRCLAPSVCNPNFIH